MLCMTTIFHVLHVVLKEVTYEQANVSFVTWFN